MFEKEAKERAKDYTSNKERQVAYECGFLDGTDLLTKEKAKWDVKFNDSNRNWNELVTDWVKDLEREVTELKEKLNYAKAIIKDLLDNSDEYARQRAMDFLQEE
jgi:hypothetical protein